MNGAKDAQAAKELLKAQTQVRKGAQILATSMRTFDTLVQIENGAGNECTNCHQLTRLDTDLSAGNWERHICLQIKKGGVNLSK